jgi:hypothetical protein
MLKKKDEKRIEYLERNTKKKFHNVKIDNNQKMENKCDNIKKIVMSKAEKIIGTQKSLNNRQNN